MSIKSVHLSLASTKYNVTEDSSLNIRVNGNATVTRPYICQRTSTYGDTSDKLGARFI